MDVGDELRAARTAARLTQTELAAAGATSQAAVSAYEAGRKAPSVATLDRLLRACGVRLGVAGPDLARNGRHLADAIALAEALPYRPRRVLGYPRLPA